MRQRDNHVSLSTGAAAPASTARSRAFGTHGLGGVSGTLLTGVFVSTGWGGDVNGSGGQFLTSPSRSAGSAHSSSPASCRSLSLCAPLRSPRCRVSMSP